MAALKVGEFLYEDGSISGPKTYMEEQGSRRLEQILSGNDAVFNMSAQYSPNIETAILVLMQTDYAGWKGSRQFFGR
jgi:hypothetical protein